jgi:hypothetical protein
MVKPDETASHVDAERQAADRAPSLSPRRLERARLLPVILTGIYAWSVGHYALARASGWMSPSGLCALGAGVVLVASPLAPSKRVSLFMVLHAFLLATLLTFWWSGTSALALVHPGYAALSWLSYTIALGALSTPEPAERPASEAAPFAPRRRASVVAPALQLLVCLVVFGLFVISLDIQRAELRILAHVVTLALGLLMLSVSVRLGHWLQLRESSFASGSLKRSAWVVLLLIGWCAVGWMGGLRLG